MARPSPRVLARRRILVGLAGLVLLVGVLLVAVFPTRTWWDQRAETAEAERELAEVTAERERVQRLTETLKTPEEIARLARQELGYVNPGEEAFSVLPTPVEPIGLPEGWPFTGVERAFGAR